MNRFRANSSIATLVVIPAVAWLSACTAPPMDETAAATPAASDPAASDPAAATPADAPASDAANAEIANVDDAREVHEIEARRVEFPDEAEDGPADDTPLEFRVTSDESSDPVPRDAIDAIDADRQLLEALAEDLATNERSEEIPADTGRDRDARAKALLDDVAVLVASAAPPAFAPAPVTTRPPIAGDRPAAPERGDVSRGGASDVSGADAPEPTRDGGDAAPEPEFRRAGPHSYHIELFHKKTAELWTFIRDTYPEWIDSGHLYQVRGTTSGLVVFTAAPIEEDALGKQIVAEIETFDRSGLDLVRRVIRPRYIDVEVLLKALVMAGLCNIYELTEEQDVLTWKEGNKDRSATRKTQSYKQTGMVQGGTAPIAVPATVPYVYELGMEDSFAVPNQYSGQGQSDRLLVAFDKTASAEERGGLMAVGTEVDLARIEAFVESVDVPARQIMIEVQLVELDANKLSDIGIDSIQFGSGHHIGTVALPLPGESIIQPGLSPDVRRDPEAFVPDTVFEGFDFAFDDTSFDLTGRFLTRLHWLVREGDATIKARPKLLTLSDRTSVLHIGREEPVFQSTGVTRDTTNGNLVSEIRQVTTQYVGFTLNIRPRITGGVEDEVTLQMEVIVNELDKRQRVFEEDLAGIPSVIKRHYIGMPRVKNHRPIILGGLIQELDVQSVNKIPLLSDIPLLGYLFRRTQKSQSRNEVILIVTPHILSDEGVDRAATPKESMHFDTFDSVLFNDLHIIKGSDVIGIDPVNRVPARGADGRIFTEEEVVDLTLLNIVKQRELVSKLDIFSSYLSTESERLSWYQRKWPERTAADWSDDDREVFFRAAAIVIENIKELNDGLKFDDIVIPRREIIIPTSPYRISLSYDKVKALQALGTQEVIRGETDIDQKFIDLLREGASTTMLNFADFIEQKGRIAADHGQLVEELQRIYERVEPRSTPLAQLAYADVYRAFYKANIDFAALATFFQASLDDRYLVTGAPTVGVFKADFHAFLKASLSLAQRGRRLLELEKKWIRMNSDDDAPVSETEDGGRSEGGE